MNILWIIISSTIILFFLLNRQRGYYYVVPIITLIPPISRMLYYLSGSAQYNALTISIYAVNMLYLWFSLRLIYKNSQHLLRIDKTLLVYMVYSFAMMIVGSFSADTETAIFAFLNTVIPMHFYFIPRFLVLDRKKFFSIALLSISGFLIWEAYQGAFGFFPWEYAYSAMREEKVTEALGKNPFSYNASYPAAMFFSILLVSRLLRETKNMKWIIFHLIVITTFFIVTMERTPIFAMIVAPLLVLIIMGTNRWRLGSRFLAVIMLFTLAQTFNHYIVPNLDRYDKKQKRLSELADIGQSDNLQARINRWSRGAKYLSSPKIIFGYGLGFYAGDRSYSTHRGMHNEYYNQIIEYGVIGFILLFLIYYRSIQLINNKNKIALLPYYSGLIVFWIIAIVNSPFLNSSKYYHWLLLGMIVSHSLETLKEDAQSSGLKR
jgi:hypothetical protein